MQTIAVFATILAAASAATIINSQRLGGNFAYSTSESQLGLIQNVVSPLTYASNVVSPYSAIGYSSNVVSTVPVSSLSGLSLNGGNLVQADGVPVSQVGNVALVRSSDGSLISGVQNVVVPQNLVVPQNVVVPATSTVVSNVGTPASTAKVSQVATPITLSSVGSVGVLPVSSVVVAKK